MSVSVTFAYSGTYKGKPVSGTVSAMPISHSQVASVVYAEIIGKAGATLNRRRNDWDCGTTGGGKSTLFRTFDASGKLEMRVEVTRQPNPEPVKPDPRKAWKAAYGEARKNAKGQEARLRMHRGPFTLTVRAMHGRVIHPAIIRDRSLTARIADALAWAAYYRRVACQRLANSFYAAQGRIDIRGALACVKDCRDIRANASAFHAIP